MGAVDRFLPGIDEVPRRSGGNVRRDWRRRFRGGQSVVLAVGPEGGFTPTERDLALQTGWSSISFSVNTLRIETAAAGWFRDPVLENAGVERMTETSEVVKMLVLGLSAGVLSGLFGIGGGLVIVPALVLIFGFDTKTAVGTSLFVILLPTGLLGVLEYWKNGDLKIAAGLWIALGVFFGAYFGASWRELCRRSR